MISGRSPEKRSLRKALGAYYTPADLARAMVGWAVRSADDTLLDPSFGGCAFFEAAIDRLRDLGSSDPFAQLAGVDIDPGARRHLRGLPMYRLAPARFKLKQDFLKVGPEEFGAGGFDAVVGNPPYVRHHRLSHEQIDTGQGCISSTGVRLPRSAGYWSYFVVHSFSFLKPGGRLAMVLPMAVLQADYAHPIRNAIAERFARASLFLIRERVFRDTDEASVVVLAEGWNGRGTSVRVAAVDSVREFVKLCGEPKRVAQAGTTNGTSLRRGALLPEKWLDVYDRLVQGEQVQSLGDLARIRIGVVTGANEFFVLRPSSARDMGIRRRYLVPIIESARQLNRLTVSARDLEIWEEHDQRCLLLAIPAGPLAKKVTAYVESTIGKRVRQGYKCRIRSPWYRVSDTATPGAFLSYVNGTQPRLVLNTAKALCTNAVHRVWWKKRYPVVRQGLIVLSFLSSFSSLGAEIHGRSYGGGALKLEPRDAAKVPIAIPYADSATVRGAFQRANECLEQKDWSSATDIADDLVLRQGLGLPREEVAALRRACEHLRMLRTPDYS